MTLGKNFKPFRNLKINNFYQSLLKKSEIDFKFGFLLTAGLSICIFGLSINSIPMIVGSMIIAPLLYSTLVLPAAIVWNNNKLLLKSIRNLLIEIVVGIAISVVLSFLLDINIFEVNLVKNLQGNMFVYFLVALISGSSAGLSLFGPNISEKLTGTAVAVALVPPIAVMGIAIDNLNKQIMLNAGLHLILNLIGIMIGAYLILSLIKNYRTVDLD